MALGSTPFSCRSGCRWTARAEPELFEVPGRRLLPQESLQSHVPY
jgi:hypothetical protein